MIPHGTAGKGFVSELARLFLTFGKATVMESGCA